MGKSERSSKEWAGKFIVYIRNYPIINNKSIVQKGSIASVSIIFMGHCLFSTSFRGDL